MTLNAWELAVGNWYETRLIHTRDQVQGIRLREMMCILSYHLGQSVTRACLDIPLSHPMYAKICTIYTPLNNRQQPKAILDIPNHNSITRAQSILDSQVPPLLTLDYIPQDALQYPPN